jgi:hypothetical protein
VADRLTSAAFRELLETVAAGWNEADARRAADCFAEDAIYLEPPDRQHYRGRQALYEFFGGDTPPPMQMRWHNVVFDELAEVGVGEYTFRGRRQLHGIVIVKVRHGRISRWREYQYASDLDWDVFVGESGF